MGTTIVGAILIAICIVPFLLMYLNRKKRESNRLHALEQVAANRNCKIQAHELCGDFAIGLDKDSQSVFFLKQSKTGDSSQYVNLAEIKSTRVGKNTRIQQGNGASTSLVSRVDLCFIPKTQNGGEIRFELFNENQNAMVTGEVPFAEKWSKTLNEMIALRK